MGGGGSKSAPPAPTIVTDPFPVGDVGLTNLSMSPGTQNACANCSIRIDARATTSTIKLTRDFGDISDVECQQYETDIARVRNNELSFRDFFVKLQAGGYSRPVSRNDKTGEAYCAQIMFNEADSAKVTDLASFDANAASLKNIRIRRVTGGGSFSSGTKAKFRLSIPIRASIATRVQLQNPEVKKSVNFSGKWIPFSLPAGPAVGTPVSEDINISMLTMYHPSPLRIENVQHDAILSLNDPSDGSATNVILIPLKSSNLGEESVGFFNKIAKHLTTISSPDSVTALYPETDIPTGNDWNIKSLFWLENGNSKNLATVSDAYFTWIGAGSFRRVELYRNSKEIRYGWEPTGRRVRYFMLQTPVAISPTDLSFLTRSLPPSPPEEAIHKIPDPGIKGNPKILYKRSTGRAAAAGCSSVVRERMTNPSPGDIASSLMTGGSMQDLLVDEKGQSLESCDPFAANARKAITNPSPFTPTKMAAYFFNFMILVAIAVGTWIALYVIANKNYDFTYRDFSNDTGKAMGLLVANISKGSRTALAAAAVPAAVTAPSAGPSLPGIPDIGDLAGKGLPSLSNLTGLLGKKG